MNVVDITTATGRAGSILMYLTDDLITIRAYYHLPCSSTSFACPDEVVRLITMGIAPKDAAALVLRSTPRTSAGT
jgi:hypothetical protein